MSGAHWSAGTTDGCDSLPSSFYAARRHTDDGDCPLAAVRLPAQTQAVARVDDPVSLSRAKGASCSRVVIHERLDVPIERSLVEDDQPSRPGELHPGALTEPDISLSTYPARATE